MPPTTSTAMAPVDDCHVAVAAEASHIAPETNWLANPPRKTVLTSRCASLIVIGFTASP